ncbi:EAL domain-containing protein [Rheinheimera sp.]|uniref:two-component system response regulator n=1 Tax=Rheinheimera sp. TaxID=1869214 RepID=UPI00307D47AB
MNHQILVVEDEYIVSLDIRRTLEQLGHKVVATLARGEDVVATALATKPDLVLMDIKLADKMRGTEAAYELRQVSDVPVIFLTAYCDERVLHQASQSFPHGYLIKPFDRKELDASIRMALLRHKAEAEVRRSEQRLRLALAAARMSPWELNLTHNSLQLIPETDDFFSLPEPCNGGTEQFLSLVSEVERPRLARLLDRGAAFNSIFSSNLSSAESYIEIFAQPTTRADEQIVLGVLRDVTQKQQEELQLRQAHAYFRTTSEAILILDQECRIVSCNPAFSLVTGYSPAEVTGKTPDSFLYVQHQSSPMNTRLDEISADHCSSEVQCRRKDGQIFPAWQHFCKVRAPKHSNQLNQFVLMFSDISALRRAEEDLQTMAFHDHLTELGNRAKLEKVLRAELERAKRNHSMLGLLYLDLDGFKLVNDTLGHHVGDMLLQQVACRLNSLIRAGDLASRVGGDEFVLLFPDISGPETCLHIAEKLLQTLTQDIQLNDNIVNVSASIGIACYPHDAQCYEELLKCADLAMFEAKDKGRSRYSFFNPVLAQKTAMRLQIEQNLKQAMQSGGQLYMAYQPVIQLQTGKVLGYESLIRWRHPQMGMVAPDKFIRVAEQSSLILDLGHWILEQVLTDMATLWSASDDIRWLSINLSVKQLEIPGLAETIASLCLQKNVNPAFLLFEITETALSQSDEILQNLDSLRALGSRVAVDDFGTGYSSLSRLRTLPIDCLKIDRSFVATLEQDHFSKEIVRAIIQLAQSLGLKVVAEGVEQAEQAIQLKALGCDKAQGYFFGKPEPLPKRK